MSKTLLKNMALTTVILFSNFSFAKTVKVKMETSLGEIILELNEKKAPISVKNFLQYAKEGFYNGTIFHRVIKGFMIQGGGLTEKMEKKSTKRPIKNEAKNGLKNEVGTIAMARTNVVDSATSQFFINVNNNQFLNHRSDDPRGFGYAVFGKVVKGMDIVNKIKAVPTTQKSGRGDVPVDNIIIKKVTEI